MLSCHAEYYFVCVRYVVIARQGDTDEMDFPLYVNTQHLESYNMQKRLLNSESLTAIILVPTEVAVNTM